MLNPQLDNQSKMLMVNHLFIQRMKRQAQIDQTVQLQVFSSRPLSLRSESCSGWTEVEEQLGRLLASRVEVSCHVRGIVLDIAASFSILELEFGLFKVGICQKY